MGKCSPNICQKFYYFCFLLSFYPAIFGFSLSSTNAGIFGRYSTPQFAIILSYTLLYLSLFILLWKKKSIHWHIPILLGIYFLSLFARANQGFRNIPYIEWSWALTRFTCSYSFFYIFCQNLKYKRDNWASFSLSLSLILFFIPALDLWQSAKIIIHKLAPVETLEEQKKSLAHASSQEKVSAGDWVIVGDSFVYGDGASKPENSFAKKMDLFLRAKKRKAHILSLRGASPSQYIEMLRAIPENKEADRVVFSFYPNDIGFSPYGSFWRMYVLYHLDGASPGIQFLRSLVAAQFEAWNVEAFHQMIVRNFDKSDATYTQRWTQLTREMEEFYALAIRRSKAKPIFLLLPILENFDQYPLLEAHKDIGILANSLGFDVLDSLPAFQESNHSANSFRAHPNDNHFNDEGHSLVAQLLKNKWTGKVDLQK